MSGLHGSLFAYYNHSYNKQLLEPAAIRLAQRTARPQHVPTHMHKLPCPCATSTVCGRLLHTLHKPLLPILHCSGLGLCTIAAQSLCGTLCRGSCLCPPYTACFYIALSLGPAVKGKMLCCSTGCTGSDGVPRCTGAAACGWQLVPDAANTSNCPEA
jgi:hypothetical protein